MVPALIGIVACAALYFFFHRGRSARDVLFDLSDEPLAADTTPAATQKTETTDELMRAGLLTRREQQDFRRTQKIIIGMVAGAALGAAALLGASLQTILVPVAPLSLAIGYIISRYGLKLRAARFQDELTFYLPVVMERIVMAVESGLDILPALRVLLDLSERAETPADPVTRLLGVAHQMTESGLPFDKALDEISDRAGAMGLRHAFVHLGLAQKEGGEIVTPLRELSDATQLYYQETVELEIAKMPVKATIPLVLTFAGLIIFFITTPMVQIRTISTGALSSQGGIHGEP